MAPNFFSKLMKSSTSPGDGNSRSRSSSAASSPTATSPSSRQPSITISPAGSPKVSYEQRNNSSVSAKGKPQLSALSAGAGYESSDSGGPNVTVIPPSPNVSENSIPLPDHHHHHHHQHHANNNDPDYFNSSSTRTRTASDTTPGQHPITTKHTRSAESESSPGNHRRLQSLPAMSPSPQPSSAHNNNMSPSLSDDGLTTPTPSGRTTFVPPVPPIPSTSSSSNSSSTAHGSMAGDPSKSPRSRNGSLSSKQHRQQQKAARAATVAEDAQQHQHLQTPKELRHQSSNRSIRSKLSIMLPSRDTSHTPTQASSRHDRSLSAPASPPVGSENGLVLVESPTGLTHPTNDSINRTLTASATTPSVGSTLLVPDNSDAVSISSLGSATSKKRRPWRRGSNASARTPRSATIGPTASAGSNKSPSRRGTTAAGGLASALAASGLAMANPGFSLPPPTADSMFNGGASAAGRARRSLDTPGRRSRSASINYGASDYSDRESFHSGNEVYSDEEGSDDSDDLDLDPEDIPVTGFAVASNKRNQDFHELFPTVPEGDYLIDDYGCALQREILIQGRLYISENHVCFHANIFGWITDLSIPMSEVISLEKRMTAFVIPNAIQLSTRTAKYTFTSFLSRDTTFDVLFNVWRLARPENASAPSLGMSPRGSLENGDGSESTDGSAQPNGKPGVNGATNAALKPKVTQCDCGKAGQHYPEVAMEAIFPGTPEKIYNLMFTSGFIKDFMREGQKLTDIQISDWMPTDDPKLLARNMTYIKPLNASIGPKQAKCELRDETVFCDFDKYKSALDGQKTYHTDLEKAMRKYIHEHQSEFMPEGIDEFTAVEEAESAQQAETPFTTFPHTPSDEEARKARERERNRRSLQWAYDTFDGAYTVAKRSAEGALELIHDAWDQSSSTTILYFVIVFLVMSNIWTLTLMGGREEVGRRKEERRIEEREKWVQGVVTALWEELLASRGNGVGAGPGLGLGLGGAGAGFSAASSAPSIRPTSDDWREELGHVSAQLDVLEQRIRDIRENVNQARRLEELD
ncbi:hypothetical protein BN946_scf184615.g5 [Trametes cinnabarina]|uniref:VASt domain-containing protein n=1 Tax=Pycnoporus cinnabarinus TaxID=5643 RepID=A0A060SW81_PYCCI|nr:hypothetical protein BN946_scf184615.g5 [Trametes cinnabarina]